MKAAVWHGQRDVRIENLMVRQFRWPLGRWSRSGWHGAESAEPTCMSMWEAHSIFRSIGPIR